MGWGGWPDKIKQAGQANNSTGNVVRDNLIRDFMLVLSDGGGIYTQGLTGKNLADGEKVTGNVIYNQFSKGHAIYTDNCSSMITVRGNVMFTPTTTTGEAATTTTTMGKTSKTTTLSPLKIITGSKAIRTRPRTM